MKEMRLADVSDMEPGNAFLEGFTERFNAKFAKVPARSDNLHRAMNVEPDRLREIFCFCDQRYVGKQLTFSYDRKRISLQQSDLTRGLVGKYVDTFMFPDRRLEVKWKGVTLPYSVFNRDQKRVTHAAITENISLSAVLAHVKDVQESEGAPAKRSAGKQRTRYKKPGRKSPGRTSFVDRHIADKKAREGSAESKTSILQPN